jgi:hypothetical protein
VWQNQKTFSTDHSTIKADDLRPYANPRPIPIRIMFFVSTGISHPIWTHRFELFAKFLAIPNTSPEVRRHTTLRLFRYAKTLIRVGRRRASLGDSDDRSGNELYPSNIRYKSDILSVTVQITCVFALARNKRVFFAFPRLEIVPNKQPSYLKRPVYSTFIYLFILNWAINVFLGIVSTENLARKPTVRRGNVIAANLISLNERILTVNAQMPCSFSTIKMISSAYSTRG